MRNGRTVAVIIPVLNEERSIAKVLSAIPDWVDDVVVVDNGSTDDTPRIAGEHGARVFFEPRRGYGSACLLGISRLSAPDVVVFLDGDYSDYPEEMHALVDPIVRGTADMVVGSRVTGRREPGALTPQAVFGNQLACTLMRWFWKVRYTDLGPFRAIRYTALERLAMRDPDYGWTVEMQIKAAQKGLTVIETPVSYRVRIGRSKVSGTIRGVVGAGTKILATIFLAAAGYSPDGGKSPGNERLIVFTRYPEPGRTKTRLIPALGIHGAAELHRKMTEHTVDSVRALRRVRPVSVEVRYEGGNRDLMARWLGPDLSYRKQGQGDLGDRQALAFEEAFRAHAARVILIGTDCPARNEHDMSQAFDCLKRHDLVLGPAADGGYYLIGLRLYFPPLFENIPWGTEKVLEHTVAVARKHGLSTAFLATREDVDRPKDLEIWERETGEGGWSGRGYGPSENSTVEADNPMVLPRETPFPQDEIVTFPKARTARAPRVSIIVPTLNEASSIARTLARIDRDDRVETIVVDGGSRDGTPEVARGLGATVVRARRGRAFQMNQGAERATGDILLFLHADTVLPDGWIDRVREISAWPNTAGGAFEFRLDTTLRWSRLIERLANIRSRVLQMPYGDQAIFVNAELFRKMGGYADLPIMEDFEFVRRLRRQGQIRIVPYAVTTSARRWKTLGVWRTTLINQAIILAYLLGLSPTFMARLYKIKRGES